MSHKLAILPGDGVGRMCTDNMVLLTNAYVPGKFEVSEYPIGLSAIDEHRTNLPQKTVNGTLEADAAYKGPTTTLDASDPRREKFLEKVDDDLNSANVKLRHKTGLRTGYRPIKNLEGLPFNLIGWEKGKTIHVYREQLWGGYGSIGFEENSDAVKEFIALYKNTHGINLPNDLTVGFDFAPRGAYEMFARDTYKDMQRLGNKTLKCLHKENTVPTTNKVFLKAFKEMMSQDMVIDLIPYKKTHTDATLNAIGCAYIEEDLCIATMNGDGDKISDLLSGLTFGAYAPSREAGDNAKVYTPSHGSAISRVGTDIFDIIPSVLSVELCLRDFEYIDEANAIEQRLIEYLKRNKGYVKEDRSVTSMSDLMNFMIAPTKA